MGEGGEGVCLLREDGGDRGRGCVYLLGEGGDRGREGGHHKKGQGCAVLTDVGVWSHMEGAHT